MIDKSYGAIRAEIIDHGNGVYRIDSVTLLDKAPRAGVALGANCDLFQDVMKIAFDRLDIVGDISLYDGYLVANDSNLIVTAIHQ